jgi:nucleoside phosphorylase
MKEIIDFVIITALDLERNAVLSYIPNLERIVTKGRIYYKGKIYNSSDNYITVVVLSLPYMGNVNASIATSQAIGVWNPRYIILTGIAGGFKKDGLHLGDLIVGEQVVYYESGKKYESFDSPRYQVQPSSMDLLNFARQGNK